MCHIFPGLRPGIQGTPYLLSIFPGSRLKAGKFFVLTEEKGEKVMRKIASLLFNDQYGPRILFIVSTILLFGFLGSKPLWTMESRWASIVLNMLYNHDYLHPYLAQHDYYDKPLMSYWLMLPFTKLFGVNTWSLRLPSAFAGGLTLWCVYQLAKIFWDKKTALFSGWMLLTSLGFLFWTHVASADILNIAGMMLALLIYQKYKSQPSFKSFLLFFIVLFLTALCKGIVIIASIGIILIPDIIYQKKYKPYFSIKFFAALAIGILIYLIPFWLSTHYNQAAYQESGLFEVFHENIVRFFAPFDHKGKWYIYFYFLPYYLFPWVFFLVPALVSITKQIILKTNNNSNSKTWINWPTNWMFLATVLLFLFFCLSQSRRSYYILPLLPFAVLITAAWLTQSNIKQVWRCIAAGVANIFVALAILFYLIITPIFYYSGGAIDFGKVVKAKASAISPWHNWQVITLGADVREVMYMQSTSRMFLYKSQQEISQEIKRSKTENNPHIIYVMPLSIYQQYQDYFSDFPIETMPAYNGKKLLGKNKAKKPIVAVIFN